MGVVIDTETHIMYFARNARTNPQSTRLKHYTWHEHDADLLVQTMDNAGVDKSFLISYDAEDTRWSSEQKGFAMEDFAGGRKYTLQGVRQFPDRFYWFNTLKNPKLYDTIALIDRDLDDGATGFKLFPAFLHAKLDSDEWRSVFVHIHTHGSRLLISFEVIVPGKSYSLPEYMKQLDIVLSGLPDLPVALLHAGCGDPLTDAGRPVAELCQTHKNVYLSCSMPGEVWDDDVEYPYRNLLRRVERLCETVGVEKLMWATDWPWFEDRFIYLQGIDCFRKHADFLTGTNLDAFLGSNAERFVRGE